VRVLAKTVLSRDLKILCQSFVQPKRYHWKVGMQQCVGTFVTYVVGQLVMQEGKDTRSSVLFDEERPPVGNAWKPLGKIGFVAFLVGEQMQVNGRPAGLKGEDPTKLLLERCEFRQ